MGFSPELGCVLIWDEGGELEGGRGDFNHSCRFKDTYQSLLTRRGEERRKGGRVGRKKHHQHQTEQLQPNGPERIYSEEKRGGKETANWNKPLLLSLLLLLFSSPRGVFGDTQDGSSDSDHLRGKYCAQVEALHFGLLKRNMAFINKIINNWG